MKLNTPPPPPLALRLFGAFELSVRGAAVGTLPRAAQWTLALLALRQSGRVERAWLASLLWPDATSERAHYYLRRCLSGLRTSLGPERARLLCPSPATLRLDLSGCACDVLAFDDARTRDDAASLEAALSVYRGPLLESCGEAWVESDRALRAESMLTALQSLAEKRYAEGDARGATQLLHRALHMDPFRESVHCRLMELLAEAGDLAGVERQFQSLRRLLHEELRIHPAAATAALYTRLRSGGGAAENRRAAEAVPAPVVRLPCPPTMLIGRRRQIEEGVEAIDRHRVVTLIGPGGIGKTRLAIALAERQAATYVDGVYFVDLSGLPPSASADRLLVALFAALNLGAPPEGASAEVVSRFLRSKRVLLLLDNCEHVFEPLSRLVNALLQGCPFLHALCTSRCPLGSPGERLLSVPPLGIPDEKDALTNRPSDLTALRASESVHLLLERAATSLKPFRLTLRNADAVARICRRLEGVPLALELAAARLSTHSPNEILAQLDEQILTLAARRGAPRTSRHGTLQATLEWSYQTLTEVEREYLARLSVFAGGWTAEAAHVVCGGGGITRREGGALLDALVRHSLVIPEEARNATERYRFVEIVRQFARQKLQKSGVAPRYVRRHAAFFAGLVRQAKPHLEGRDASAWLLSLELERENLSLALRYWEGERPALASAPARALRMATGLSSFWAAHNDLRHGRETLIRLLEGRAPAGCRYEGLLALGRIETLQGQLLPARRRLREALRLVRAHDGGAGAAVVSGVARALQGLGIVASEQGRGRRAEILCRHALRMSRESGDLSLVAFLYGNLGNIAKECGQLETAADFYEESLRLHRAAGRTRAATMMLFCTGLILHTQLRFQSAIEIYEKAGADAQALGDQNILLYVSCFLSGAHQGLGQWENARACARRYERIARESGRWAHVSIAHRRLAYIGLQTGDLEEARTQMRFALDDGLDVPDSRVVYCTLEIVGIFAVQCDRALEGVLLFGAAHRLNEDSGGALRLHGHDESPAALDSARAALTPDVFEAAWARGYSLRRAEIKTIAQSLVENPVSA